MDEVENEIREYYRNSILIWEPIYGNIFLMNKLNLERITRTKQSYKYANEMLTKHKIKMELNKPFLQKLYELKGTV